uniref:Lipase_3 domain-containing protein n=1 Tax=Caenorhabditis tropicalis TaxID=1561998 RepID=A0A1I7UHL0_9PELO
MKLYQVRTVNCSADYPDVTCRGFTAYDLTQRVIVISFRGSHGTNQMIQLNDGFANDGIQEYFDKTGKIFKTVYDSFMLLWNGGMYQDIKNLKYRYPDFELWVNGHSLGGMLSWVASSYLVISGLYKPENIKVVTMASPRLGDYNFAVWYTGTFPYSYHIIHRNDGVPRSLKIDPHTNTTELFHPRTQVCDAVTDGLTMEDHLYYFDVCMPVWGRDGCPKNRTAYAQPVDQL